MQSKTKYIFNEKNLGVSAGRNSGLIVAEGDYLVNITEDSYICLPPRLKMEYTVPQVDCWRFLPDGYRALTKWCPESKLLDSYVDIRPGRDCVGIFKVTK